MALCRRATMRVAPFRRGTPLPVPCRRLCTFPEPSEVKLDPNMSGVPTRPTDLLNKEEEPKARSKAARFAIGASSLACSTCGLGVLAYNHWMFLQPYLLDVVGVCLVGASVALKGCGFELWSHASVRCSAS